MSNIEITDTIVARYNDANNNGEGFAVGDDVDASCADAARSAGMTVLDTDCEGDALARDAGGRLVYVGDSHGPWGCYVDAPALADWSLGLDVADVVAEVSVCR